MIYVYVYLSSSRSHHRSGCVHAVIRSSFRVRLITCALAPPLGISPTPPPPNSSVFVMIIIACRNDILVLVFASRCALCDPLSNL